MFQSRNGLLNGLNAGMVGGRREPAPALLITNSTDVYNLDRTGQTGAVKMQGFTTWAGYIDLAGNSYTSLDIDAVTISNGAIQFRDNAIAVLRANNLTQINELFDLWGNPLTSVAMDALVSNAAGKHIYLSRNPALLSASFQSLATLNAALVLSRNYNMASLNLDSLVTLNHEIECDYCKALPIFSVPSLTTINKTAAGPNIILGGDMTDIGQSRPPALHTVSWPVLANLNDANIVITWCSGLTSIPVAAWTTIANGIRLDFNRNAFTQATQDAILAKLVAIRGGVTTGYLDMRFQTGGATPSAGGYADKATLVAAWGAGNVLTD